MTEGAAGRPPPHLHIARLLRRIPPVRRDQPEEYGFRHDRFRLTGDRRVYHLGPQGDGSEPAALRILHGEDDQVVPIDASARLSVDLLKNGTLKTYPGFSHGMLTVNADVLNADMLAFFQA